MTTSAIGRSLGPSATGATSRADLLLRPRRLGALAASETRLLLRNRALAFYTLALPLLVAAPVAVMTGERSGLPLTELGAHLLIEVTCLSLGFGVFFSLVSTLVARRQDLVLKRLRASELSAAEILGGTVIPMWLTCLVQVAIGYAAAAALLQLGPPAQPVPMLLAIAGGGVLVALLAAATSGLTRTTESAQVTTLPVIFLMMLSPGVLVPASALPEQAERVLQFLPFAPIAELMGAGFTAADGGLAELLPQLARPAGLLLAWCVIGVMLATRTFRWEPRR